MSTQLAALGIDLIEGYDPEQLDAVAQDADVFVIGNVITRGNPLMEAILDPDAPTSPARSGCTRTCSSDKWVLAVAGTHGKTTAAAMLAWILERTGLAPGFLIGGVPLNFGVSARSPTARSSSSRPTNTTPRSSTSARSSSITGRAR